MTGDREHPDVELETEQTFSVTGRGAFVMVRIVQPGVSFTLSDEPAIDGVRIERWLEMPRKLDSDGRARTDCFVFKLLRDEDVSRLRAGQRVLLA